MSMTRVHVSIMTTILIMASVHLVIISHVYTTIIYIQISTTIMSTRIQVIFVTILAAEPITVLTNESIAIFLLSIIDRLRAVAVTDVAWVLVDYTVLVTHFSIGGSQACSNARRNFCNIHLIFRVENSVSDTFFWKVRVTFLLVYL